MSGSFRLATVTAASVLIASCSTQATLHRRGEPPLRGHIVGSGGDAVHVRTNGGVQLPISRSKLVEIDHPGNVVAIAGACVLAIAASIATQGGSQAEMLTTGAILGVPGVAMLTWGTVVYLRSKRAAARFTDQSVPLRTLDASRPYVPAPTWDDVAPGTTPTHAP